ncbi:MAG: methylmalonyl-CoA epimerase, partial [Dehalococcoidia bacterium]
AVCTAEHLNHVAIVVKNVQETLDFYRETFGVGEAPIEEIPDQGVRATLISIGGSQLELIEPTRPDTGVARFLENRGEGLHHVCFEVEDLRGKLNALNGKGFQLIDKAPRKGLAGMIAFIHPKATRGVLIELVDKV